MHVPRLYGVIDLRIELLMACKKRLVTRALKSILLHVKNTIGLILD